MSKNYTEKLYIEVKRIEPLYKNIRPLITIILLAWATSVLDRHSKADGLRQFDIQFEQYVIFGKYGGVLYYIYGLWMAQLMFRFLSIRVKNSEYKITDPKLWDMVISQYRFFMTQRRLILTILVIIWGIYIYKKHLSEKKYKDKEHQKFTHYVLFGKTNGVIKIIIGLWTIWLFIKACTYILEYLRKDLSDNFGELYFWKGKLGPVFSNFVDQVNDQLT